MGDKGRWRQIFFVLWSFQVLLQYIFCKDPLKGKKDKFNSVMKLSMKRQILSYTNSPKFLTDKPFACVTQVMQGSFQPENWELFPIMEMKHQAR